MVYLSSIVISDKKTSKSIMSAVGMALGVCALIGLVVLSIALKKCKTSFNNLGMAFSPNHGQLKLSI